MNLKVYCVFDSATQVYGTPMFLISNGQAIRSFTDEVNREDANSSLYMHPEDYSLYYIGDFDNGSARMEQPVDMECISRGKDVALKLMETN